MLRPFTTAASGARYIRDDNFEIRDAVIVERNGDLRLIRDDETGEELYRFASELS